MTTATDTKEILIVTVGKDPKREVKVTLQPGTLVTDALEQAGFLGYRLQKPAGGNFELAENLYDQVADGQKLQAVDVNGLSAG